MPHYLAIGLSKNEILHDTIVGLRVYDEAFKLKREMQDEMLYLSGIYTYEAVSVALANSFRKQGTQAIKYRAKPILQEIKPLTEEEIEQKREEFVARMKTLMANFKATHKTESNNVEH